MKTLKYIALAFATTAMLASCGDSWMETSPTASTGSATVFQSTDNVKMAVNGLAKMMTTQYLSSQGFNGEGTIKTYYNEYPSNDYHVSNLPGWGSIINMQFNERSTSIYDYYPWYYYYKIIGNANSIILHTDEAQGSDAEKAYLKAEALTFRAYCYTQLATIYCYRWSDSNNGASQGLVLRIDESQGDLAVSTLADTYKQIYADLDEAIKLFKESGKSGNADEYWMPTINVAYATYARAALNRQDYQTALTNAKLAREGYPLMSNDDYKSGFSEPNQEWIWGIFGDEQETLYYYQFFAYNSYNSSAGAVRNYPKCISRELFNQIPDEDIRKSLFLDPNDTTYNPKHLKYTASTGFFSSSTAVYKNVHAAYPDMDKRSKVAAYMNFKFKATAMPGVGSLNLFRSAEMVLIEAEANYYLNNAAAAQAALNELNQPRNSSYKCTSTGAELLSEIKLYRRFELWGEGFNWSDFKRWGDPIVRHAYANGGNFLASEAVTISPDDGNHWTWIVPNRETDYNHGFLPEEE